MNPNLRVVILDQDALPPHPLHFDFPHTLTIHAHTLPHELPGRLALADIVITGGMAINGELLRQNPHLCLIALAATGHEHIDIDAAHALGITVCHVQAYGSSSVAEHAMMLMLVAMRNLPSYQTAVAHGQWQKSPFFCHIAAPMAELNGKNLTILGRGDIGRAVAQRAAAFGMHIIWAEHRYASVCRPGYTPFQTALSQADILSLHCPLTPQTHHVLDAETLSWLPHTAVIVNVGRGALIDEAALLQALQQGHVRAAAVDVLENEPPPVDHALLQAQLPNLIVTPHVAWASEEAMQRLSAMLQDNIHAFVCGQPINTV